ncbi:Uncharacterized protein Adt_44900 [Abeliophyllum distichum]|uniref:Uncharacterized protein n=1 Tax=Abeliophyllum distichum TaxID=126358 RepID=A0ABD1PC52_9LAMI
MPIKRKRRPGILTKSPYLDGRKTTGELSPNFRFDASAFQAGLVQPSIDDVLFFDEWFHDGYKPDNIKRKFLIKKININPPFDFGPIEVRDKTWWYELRDPDESL